jgi:Ethanolamine utilization protein EutJ (predicted chaperonin)
VLNGNTRKRYVHPTSVGSEIVMKNEKGIRITGRVTGISVDKDGLVTYKIRGTKSGSETTVQADKILSVGKKKAD